MWPCLDDEAFSWVYTACGHFEWDEVKEGKGEGLRMSRAWKKTSIDGQATQGAYVCACGVCVWEDHSFGFLAIV